MFKKTILATAIALGSTGAIASDVDQIIQGLESEANSIMSEHIEFEAYALHDAQIDEFNATGAASSYYNRIASFSNENLRVRFAKMFLRIYENALTRTYSLLNRIERFPPKLRDRIKRMGFYQNMQKRVSFYEAEVAKYKSLLNGKAESSRDVQVVENTEVVTTDPVLVRTTVNEETRIEDGMRNTYEVTINVYQTTTTTTVTQTTTTTIKYTDGTEKVTVAEKVLSVKKDVDNSETSDQILLSSVPLVEEEEVEEKVVVKNIYSEEFYGNYGLSMVGVDEAYKQGYTGKGVTVGIVDSGLTDLNDKFDNVVLTHNMFDGSTDVTDENGHGTHVAGIIGANKNDDTMHGVAFNSDLVIVKALDARGVTGYRNLSRAITWSGNAGSDVTNVSISGNLVYNLAGKSDLLFNMYFEDLKPLMEKDAVVVVAAGNSRLDCKVADSTYWKWEGDQQVFCGFPAALPYIPMYEGLEDQWIAVGAVDSTGKMARYSNKAGVSKDWYMVAPGTDVLSTSADGGFVEMSGTSMAAPMVTGAFALLAEKYPHLTNKQIREILFATADDLGEEGVDEVYGHGLLNVGSAMAPVGDLALPNGATVDSGKTPVKTMGVAGAAGLGEAIASSAAVSQVGIMDDYDRVYHMDMTPTIIESKSMFSFDNYLTAEAEGLLYGLNQAQNDIHSDLVIGYQLTEAVSLLYGSEKGAFGSQDSDVLGFGVDSTDYIRLGYTGETFNVNLDYGYAKGGEGKGVIESTSDMHGLGFSMTKTAQFKNSTYTMGLSSPIKVESGTAQIKTLTSRSIDGTLNYSSENVDLSNSDREYTLTNSYTQRVGSSSTVRFNHSIVSGGSAYNTASVTFNYNF